jgi:hypothetical protein
MGHVYLSKDLRAFAEMLGKRRSKFMADCGAENEIKAIAKWRLSLALGLDWTDDAFLEIWEAVDAYSIDCMTGDDDDGELDPLTVPTEEEFGDMPFRSWRIIALDASNRELRTADVEGRTSEEAARRAGVSSIEGMQAYRVMHRDPFTGRVWDCYE